MDDSRTFLSILTHKARLRSQTQDLSLSELKKVKKKLEGIIAERIDEEKHSKAREERKRQLIIEMRNKLKSEGFSVNEADMMVNAASADTRKLTKKTGVYYSPKKPPKYVLTTETGEKVYYRGVGRMPKAFEEALAAGYGLEDFAIPPRSGND